MDKWSDCVVLFYFDLVKVGLKKTPVFLSPFFSEEKTMEQKMFLGLSANCSSSE